MWTKMNVASVGGACRLAGGVATYLGDLSEPFVTSQKVVDFPEDTLLRIYVGIYYDYFPKTLAN